MSNGTVQISGASDDLIEVAGTVQGCDEFGVYDHPGFVEFDSGDVFKVEYGKTGAWRVEHHVKAKGSKLKVDIVRHPEGDDPEPYTDIATVKGPMAWVDFWEHWPPTIEDVKDKVVKRLDDGITADQAQSIFVALYGTRKWSPVRK